MSFEPIVYGFVNEIPVLEYERWLSVSHDSPFIYHYTPSGTILLSPPQMGRALTIQADSSIVLAFGRGGSTYSVNTGDVFYVNPSYTDAVYLISGNATVFHSRP